MAAIPFEDFLMTVAPGDMDFVLSMHDYFMESGCALEIKSAKSGYVVSYKDKKTKRVLVNYVSRKKGMIMRIYGDNCGGYMDFIGALPERMIREIEKAPVCKRLVDPAKCNSRCPMGYTVALGGETHKKCRYSGFMFLLGEESNPHIRQFVEHEVQARAMA